MIATNAYHYYGLCYNFMKIKECTGWEPFKQTFRYFNSLASQSVPTTNMGKLNLFIIKLRDYSGQNVIGMLTTQEKNIYATKFGGAIEYYTGTLYTDDHSNYVSSGTFMTLGTPIDGSIEYAGDEDWFRFTTTNAGTYTITTSDYSPSSFFMYLHKTDTISYIPAIETTFLDDGVTVFKFDLPAETAYSVRIYPYGSSGDYTVCVDGVKPLNETGGKTHGKKRAKQAGRNKNRAGKRIADGRKNMPGAEPTAEKSIVAHDGTEQPQAPAQSDIAADKAIPPDKAVSEQQAVKAAEKSTEDKKEPEAPTMEDKTPDKKVVRKGRPPADKTVKSPNPEKAPKPPKAEKAATPPKAKAAADIRVTPKKKRRPLCRNSRPNRGKLPARVNRNRLLLSLYSGIASLRQEGIPITSALLDLFP